MRVTVAEGTQVNLDGTLHEAGASFEVDDEHVELPLWLAAGYVVEASSRASRRK